MTNLEDLKDLVTIIVAVLHSEYRVRALCNLLQLYKDENKIIIDIEGILNNIAYGRL
ncbi:hypothetical protein J1C67_09635 [Clostridium gasigenes]|uniref:hypothetical protein n=1 Tax=Clostridium gasigenes TaxID=94869 RepID=UPI00143866BB|nr:hypothetical protein [Clostridium gasigenes]NKF08516.1 hypothetical protein [Clostridium gasigenes]QSW21328.1 hypothetical protein J1C67_09635 [Clostridium gasigenes]